ncbi:unnamed protein product [Oppiella nova]|uniref:Protein zer-1 homolog-like C-terminal domain-containing protein n=1 Tax=Oppiella nova TaxID=334625 RepID=A0A7R9QRI3_9ACAR|nr:unnamed protein product [Oppiella nova]CAG2172743.1 unnamed protein product [Oppiella nova]
MVGYSNKVVKCPVPRCNYWDNGCRQVVKLSDITEHSATCERNEANGFKLCDTCCCNITGDHKCLDAVVLANRKANDRIDLLQCTVNQLTLEKDQLVKSVQELSNVQSDDRLIKDNRQLRHEVQELKKEKTIENVRVFGNILSMIGNDNVDLAENIGSYHIFTHSFGKYKCPATFGNIEDVIEAMLGVISNVAEYDELKPQLLANKYIQSLLKLLETSVYKQSINCKSAGILTNLAAIGINNWPDNLGDDCKFDKAPIILNYYVKKKG